MAARIYKAKDGKRLPGVTTILSRFKDSGGLIHWAWNLGIEGKDYREVRDKAAEQGTKAHELVEKWIHGEPFELEQQAAEVQTSFGAFLRWADQSRLQPYRTEVSLVSERYRFGGTLDAMLVHDGLALGDWKTSNSVYGEYLMQLAAYGILWEENFPDEPITAGYNLMRFAKDTGDFAHYRFPDLDKEKQAFKLLAEAYPLVKQIEKRVK